MAASKLNSSFEAAISAKFADGELYGGFNLAETKGFNLAFACKYLAAAKRQFSTIEFRSVFAASGDNSLSHPLDKQKKYVKIAI